MWREWKKGFRLLKYAYNYKANIGFGIFFLVCGFFMSLLDAKGFLIGGVYFYLGTVMLMQLDYNLLYSQMVVASTKRRFIDLSFANFLSNAGAISSYLFLSITAVVLMYLRPEDRLEYSSNLVVLGILMVVCMIYYAVCYKTFVVGSIIFSIAFASIYALGLSFLIDIAFETVGLNFIMGLVIILIGCALSVLIRRSCYHMSVSSLAMGAALRKAMK